MPLDPLLEMYEKNGSFKVAKMLGISETTVKNRLLKQGLWVEAKKRRKTFCQMIPTCHNPLETWTPDSAYLVGYALGDGSLHQKGTDNKITLTYWSTDRCIIEHITQLFKIDPHKIRTSIYKDKGVYKQARKPLLSIDINDMNVASKMMEYGLVINKSRLGCDLSLPEGNFNHFLRGLFDADGSVSKRKVGHKLIVSIHGHPSYMEQIYHVVPHKWKWGGVRGGLAHIRLTDAKIIRDMCDWLYSGSTIYLNRKKLIFDTFFQGRTY